MFTFKQKINEHMTTHSTGTKPFNCGQCPMTFSSRGALYNHRKIHLPPEFKCNFCPKMFVQKHNRDRHYNTHTGAKPFECEQCHKRIAHSANLKDHRERHHSTERKYKCEICDKKFATGNNLWSHKKTHSAPQFECPFCKQKFTLSSSCRTHWKGNKHQAIRCQVRRNQLASTAHSNSFSSEGEQLPSSSVASTSCSVQETNELVENR